MNSSMDFCSLEGMGSLPISKNGHVFGGAFRRILKNNRIQFGLVRGTGTKIDNHEYLLEDSVLKLEHDRSLTKGVPNWKYF